MAKNTSKIREKALMEYRDGLITHEVEFGELMNVEIAQVFKISPQLLRSIIKKYKLKRTK